MRRNCLLIEYLCTCLAKSCAKFSLGTPVLTTRFSNKNTVVQQKLLNTLFTNTFTFQIDSRIRGEFYSTCISFNDVDEVEKAFEALDGQMTKVNKRA